MENTKKIQEIKKRLENGEIQFLNDSNNSNLFCELTDITFNGYGYYYAKNCYCATPFDLPIIKLSEIENKKMTTQEKAEELVYYLGVSHAIYVTEEVIAILEDWEGTELAQKDWVEIQEIIRSMEKLTFKPYKEQILVQSSIDGEVIWEDKK